MKVSRAFTVLELIVCLAILMLLIGLLLPTLHRVRGSGQSTKCLANMRSLCLAHELYMNDHRGYFIDVGLAHGGLANEEVAWINTLESYYDHALVRRSPRDDSPHWPAEEGGQGVPVPGSSDSFRRTSYGCNNYISRTYSPAAAIDPANLTDRITRIKNPVTTVQFLVMAFTGSYAGSDHVHVEQWWNQAAGPNFPPVKAASQMQTNAHGGAEKSWAARSGYGFLDGHVASLQFSEVYINRDDLNCFDPAVSTFWTVRMAR
jgi:prepilin-type processing-associated H-X9-DG protein